LWADPHIIITSRVSVASDQDLHGAIAFFCDNLRDFITGRNLRNVID
jgi:hypothetical protein